MSGIDNTKKDTLQKTTPREFVDLLDELIQIRQCPLPNPDTLEAIKRQMADYLIVTNPNKGVFFAGEKDNL